LLGSIIPFLHFYDDFHSWYVVHHIDLVNNIQCGIASLSPSPGTEKIPTELNPTLNFNYFNTLINSTFPSNTILQIGSKYILFDDDFTTTLLNDIEH
jgi:hypothetical protein